MLTTIFYFVRDIRKSSFVIITVCLLPVLFKSEIVVIIWFAKLPESNGSKGRRPCKYQSVLNVKQEANHELYIKRSNMSWTRTCTLFREKGGGDILIIDA